MKAGLHTIFFAWLLLFVSGQLYAQSALEVFGKNRVQHKNFQWKYISTINFEVYYYQEGNELAYFAARHAEADFDRIADLLGYTPYSKTKIFIYNSLTDLQQSNVGLNNDVPLIGGQTNFIKSRIEIAYPGNSVDFKKELSMGIAQMYITEMMFGGSLKDMVQSSYLLSLPEWFVTGAAAYVAEGWGAEMDDYMRDMIMHKRALRPAVLSGEEAQLAGQAIWNYIAERYGKSNISNILNLTRIIRNEESSIVSTLGVYPYSNFLRDWQNFYASVNAPLLSSGATMPEESLRMRKNANNRFIYNEVKISPDGKLLAYSETYRGKFRVYVRNTTTGKKKTIMVGGYRVIDQKFDKTIPLLGWRNNTQLVVMHSKEGEYAVSLYDVTKNFLNRLANRKLLKSIVQVNNFDVSEDGKQLVMSAVRNGRSDIFLYDISRGAISQLTDDSYDDLYPQFLSARDLIFSSNRLTDSLKTGHKIDQNVASSFRLYAYEPEKTAQRVRLLADIPGNSIYPVVTNEQVYFLNDMTGLAQLYQYQATSGQVQQMSNFRQNVRIYDLQEGSFAYVMLNKRKEFVGYVRNATFKAPASFIQTKRSELVLDKINPDKTTGLTTAEPTPAQSQETTPVQSSRQLVLEPGEVDTENYEFDVDPNKPQNGTPGTTQSILATVNEGKSKKQNVQIRGPFAYQSLFSTDNAVTSLVIDPIRGLGLTFDVTMNEMLEDHVIKGGATGFFDLASSNFYGEYKYLKKRLDVGVRYDKKTYFFNNSAFLEFTQRYTAHQLQFPVSYPLTVSNRVTVAPLLLFSRYVEAQLNTGSAPPVAATGYGGLRAEYVFDNTTINGLNMLHGTRMRIRYTFYRGVTDKDSIVDPESKSFNNISVDLRHYQKVHRDIVLALRLAYGRFAGKAPKQYLLGGMDNWAFNDKDSREQNDPLEIARGKDNRDILFNEFVTNMRGFPFNKLSGNSFLLFNAEFRLPLIKYFYRGPITSNFFKNLQFVGFTDVGTAWSGESPFSRKNSLNTQTIRRDPLLVTVTNFKNPFLIGYGAGARTLLFGYYLKFDVAWGVEDFVVSEKPRYYLTLGYDF